MLHWERVGKQTRMLVWNIHVRLFRTRRALTSHVLRIFARRYVFSSVVRSFVRSGNIFSRGKEELAKGDALFCATVFGVRVSPSRSIHGAARRARARARAQCLRLYLLYSVACQPIYIGLDSAFTSRTTGTRPEEHRQAARFSLTISARLIFAKLHPSRAFHACTRTAPLSAFLLTVAKLRRLLVRVARVKRDAARFCTKGRSWLSSFRVISGMRIYGYLDAQQKRFKR